MHKEEVKDWENKKTTSRLKLLISLLKKNLVFNSITDVDVRKYKQRILVWILDCLGGGKLFCYVNSRTHQQLSMIY